MEHTIINKCICGITNGSPYDTSIFPNNKTTFYTQIDYSQINNLLLSLCSNDDLNIKDPRIQCLCKYFRDDNVDIIFRFNHFYTKNMRSHFVTH